MKREKLQRVFSHIPTLKTERLLLRKIVPTDALDMYAYARLPQVTAFLLWKCHPDREYTRQYIEYLQSRYAAGDFFDFAVALRENDRMIGTCGFTSFDTPHNEGELGYVLHPDFHGQGLATEAAGAVLRFGFETLGLHRITARCMEENRSSLRVMEKCGMQREGLLRDAVYKDGRYHSLILSAILAEEF